MNVYIRQNELQNAYIGEYVEPIFNYSYTFKGKTAAEIGNTWTLLTGTLQTNSDGVTGSSNTDCRIKVDIPSLANAKRIVISGTVVVDNNGGPYNGASLTLSRGSGWGNGESGYRVYGSGYSGMRVFMSDGNTGVNGNVVGNATPGNTYSPTTTIDLVNKTITGVMSGFDNSILILTDSQISTLRTFTYLVVYASLNKSAVSDVSITIE